MNYRNKKKLDKKAVSKTVNWWVKKMMNPLNQDNGDDSDAVNMALMMIPIAVKARESMTKDAVRLFKEKLTDELMIVKDCDWNFGKRLGGYYLPDLKLRTAAEYAGIDLYVFPCRTWTRIDKRNNVFVSMGYGSPEILI